LLNFLQKYVFPGVSGRVILNNLLVVILYVKIEKTKLEKIFFDFNPVRVPSTERKGKILFCRAIPYRVSVYGSVQKQRQMVPVLIICIAGIINQNLYFLIIHAGFHLMEKRNGDINTYKYYEYTYRSTL